MKSQRINFGGAIECRAPTAACAIVLAGGRGTRISHLHPDVPKPFIKAAGLPFIAWVLRHLREQGLRRAVVSLGHLAEVGREQLAKCGVQGLRIDTVAERSPLGTAGALRYAAEVVPDADPLMLLNGDSLVTASFEGAWRALTDPACDGALLGVDVLDASRFGRLEVDSEDRLTGFREKQPGAGLVNAGVYFLRRSLLAFAPPRNPLSMETEFIPAILAGGARLTVCRSQADFIDIGTPDTVREASDFITQHYLPGATT
jgi:D-glycero-alpha-D-manno-heptose 1-phosphate guanylyltransferase